mgnify:CR=1 FL=1
MSHQDALTPKQERFCHEYLIDLNATQAAVRALYSVDSASEQGSRLLGKLKVQELIYKLNQVRIEETKINANFVLTQLHAIANSNVKDMFDESGMCLPIKQIPDCIAKTIQSFDVEERVVEDPETGEVRAMTKTIKVKLWSKDKSLENLGKHLKLFTDKMEVSASMTLENIIGNSMKDKK